MIKKLKTLLAIGAITVITAGSAVPVSALTTKTTTKSKGVVYLCINGKKYKFNINSNCTNKPSVPDTDNNNGSTSKPDNNTGSNNDSTSKPDNNTGSDNGSTSKPDNNTGSNNGSTSKPDNNTGSNNGSTSKPDNNTGSNNGSTSKPDNNTGSDSNNSGSTNQGSTSFAAYQQEVVNLVNKERAKYGLSALKSNSSLANVATIKSQDMVNKNYFNHTSPTYGSPFDMMKQFGISYNTAGENIAMGQKTPSEVVTAWMNSEGHRKNILSSNFTQIGVGVAKNASGQLYWTQMFIG